MIATARKTKRARTFSPSEIVKVYSGGVKYQLTSRNPLTAATSAGQRPPTADTSDDEQQEEEQHARQPELVAQLGEQDGQQRRAGDGEHEADRDPPARQRAGRRVARDDERVSRGPRDG